MPSPIGTIKRERARRNTPAWGFSLEGLLRDKILFDHFLRGAGFPAPEPLGVIADDAYRQFWPERRTVDLEDVPAMLAGHSAFVKRARGKGGAGSFAVEFTSRGARIGHDMLSGKKFAAHVRALMRRGRKSPGSQRLVVQEKLANAPEVAAIYDQCINTVRFLTHYHRQGPEVFSVLLRVGAFGSVVDNWDAGGLVIPVDPDTGRLTGPGVVKKTRQRLKRHPDSGRRLEGVQLPCFGAARRMVEMAHVLLPDLVTIGWDVALTPDGPMILEANTKWDITMHHLTDPDFASFVTTEIFPLKSKVS